MENFNIDIRQSKKWKDFLKWFFKSQIYHNLVTESTMFETLPFEFQSGVYIKYIEEELKHVYMRNFMFDTIKHQLCTNNNAISSKYWDVRTFNTLEELILYTFNG